MNKNNPGIKSVVVLAVMIFIILSLPILALALLLLAHGGTCQGRLFAGAVIFAIPIPVLLLLASYFKRKHVCLMTTAALGILSAFLLLIDYNLTPDGLSLSNSAIRSCFTGPGKYQRISMANLVPEMDQLLLATYVIPAIDPLMDKSSTTELRDQVSSVYGEMQRAPEFECLGSVLNQTYQHIFTGKPPVGHFYEYIPQNKPGRLPAVIFLHGSLGNFKGYLWVWKRIADEQGFAILAPTFGTGNWDEPGGEDAIERMLQYCKSHSKIDSSRIYLAGISNGGRGVCLGVKRSPDAYRGLIFISPVLDQEMLLTNQFANAWKNKPVLILHGTADNRISVDYIKDAIESLKNKGIRIDSELYDAQTHFLFFTIRDKVQDRIGSWLKSN